MSKSDPEVICQFLTRHLPDPTKKKLIMNALGGYCAQADSGRFVISPDPGAEVVGLEASHAFGYDVLAIPVSVSQPFPRPEQKAVGAYKHGLIQACFQGSGRFDGVWRGFACDLSEHRLARTIMNCLTNPLRDSFEGVLGTNRWANPADALHAVFLCYIVMHLAGYGDEAEHRLAPLIRRMSGNPIRGHADWDYDSVLYLVP